MDKFSVFVPKLLPQKEHFLSGRRSCKGCGKAMAARIASKAVARDAVLAGPSGPGPLSAAASHGFAHDRVTCDDMIENTFDYIDALNGQSAHRAIKKPVVAVDREVLQSDYLALTRVLQNDKPALYLCFDNEQYVDKFLESAAPQPFIVNEAPRAVTPEHVAELIREKQLPPLVNEGDFSYAATAGPGYPFDLIEKVKKGISCPGNAFILILTPCPTGWIFPSGQTAVMGRLAVQTGYFPLYEIDEGKLTITQRLEKRAPVGQYLMKQRRFMILPPPLLPALQQAVDSVYEDLLQKEKQD